MKATPILDRVIILPNPPDEIVDGVIIPDVAKDAPVIGTAMYCGPSCRQVKDGDTVLFPKNYGTDIMLNGKKHIILKEDQVHTILRP